MFIAASCGILAFYAVLMGWTGQTLFHALFVGLPENKQAADAFFDALSGGNSALAGQGISLLLTALVVAAGVQGGIERLSRWALPLLLVLLIGLVIWASTLPGAGEGYRTFLFRWDGAQLMNLTTIRNAFSQAFFSIGTGIGSIMAYSVYLNQRARLPQQAAAVVGLDTSVGLLAGMLTFPVVISFNLSDVVSDSTIGAIFIALPTGLASIGMTGQVVAVLFFALAYLAATTSSVSLLEVPVSSLMDRVGWSRSRATWISTAVIFVLGIPASMSLEVLGVMDAVFGNVLLMTGGLLIAVLMGWVVPTLFLNDLKDSDASSPQIRRVLIFCLQWISPVVIAAGLLISVVDLLRTWFAAS